MALNLTLIELMQYALNPLKFPSKVYTFSNKYSTWRPFQDHLCPNCVTRWTMPRIQPSQRSWYCYCNCLFSMKLMCTHFYISLYQAIFLFFFSHSPKCHQPHLSGAPLSCFCIYCTRPFEAWLNAKILLRFRSTESAKSWEVVAPYLSN